jgi:hypothetical protein
MNNISLSQLKTYAMTNFPDVYRELPSHTALRPKYSSGCFELCIGRLGNAGHYPGSNIKLGDPVYAVNIESRFQLRHDDNYTVILPKDILFEAPFCYLYPNGPPSYTTHDLEILLRYYFESYGVSVPRDPCGPEFQPYGQQFQSACTKVAEGQANNTRISMVTGQLGGIVAGTYSDIQRCLELTSTPGNIEIITVNMHPMIWYDKHLDSLLLTSCRISKIISMV